MSVSLANLQLRTLAAISQIIARALQLEETLHDVLRILSETLSMKRATVTLLDRETGHLVISASHGLSPEEKRRGVYRLGEGVTGAIFQTAKPYVIPDIRTEPLFLDKTGSRSIEKDRVTFIGVPILLHGEAIGVLNVDRLFSDDISAREDIEFLQVVATLIAQFISLNDQVRDLRRENATLRSRLGKTSENLYMVGRSLPMQEVQRQIEKVAPTRATVLLLGESGTGKTLIGRIIHDLSERKSGPFIKVNCAAIPENLLESELFGHEKGAFTGAVAAKRGKFEEAHTGTIFLDEIGEMPLGLQAKLLRILQDREFERIGSTQTRKVDVRIIAASNRDLGRLAETGDFRPDLYYRLNVFPIHNPPLRERKEDMEGLLLHFLSKVSREYGRELHFTPAALALLRNHDWPGNVREMENLVERLVILSEGGAIDRALIHSAMPRLARGGDCLPGQLDAGPGLSAGLARAPSLKEVEKAEILAALARNDWIQARAARELGLTARQIGYKINNFKLGPTIARHKGMADKED